MAGFEERCIPYEMKCNRIKVLDYKGKNIRGILYNPFFDSPQYFDNLAQCLFLMERVMDEIDFPNRGTEHRVFHSDAKQDAWQRVAVPGEEKLPVLATFHITVMFRQNASWQGSLLWQEKELDAPFRSVLELIGLFDNALSFWE